LNDVIAMESVNATETGKEALLQLAGGDMRRVLNLLQSTHMAYPELNEESVYLTAGAAIPAIIRDLLQSLLNDTFQVAYTKILHTTTQFGYALTDINTEISTLVSRLVHQKKNVFFCVFHFLTHRLIECYNQ